MIISELRVILKDADQCLNFVDTAMLQVMQVKAIQGIGKALLVLADLELSKAEREEGRIF